MLNYRLLNNITGWVVFLVATAVYFLTIEPTASFWDCGEFIAASYKLQVPHPPGAPLFLLIGRIFSLFAGDVTQVAVLVNAVSALSSSFTILFLFWTITLIAKKIVMGPVVRSLTNGEIFTILGSGLVGSLAFTFTDSFWFSAVEAEVYAMSSFFTAFVFWAMLKWEEGYGNEGNDRWIVLLAYMVGLSIGVHILNLVALPGIGFIYYFKKYKPTVVGIITTFVVSASLIGVVVVGIIPGLPSIASSFEILFVNSFGLPFNSGIIFFIVIFLGALIWGITYSVTNRKEILNLILVSFTFILIGYASYGIILIRSNYNPPIDENDPENVITFVSYLKREQYGDRPLLKGQYYTAGYPIDDNTIADLYMKDEKKGKYVKYDEKKEYIYDPAHVSIFPRAYSVQPGHKEAYEAYMGPPKQKVTNHDGSVGYRPSMGQNLTYFFRHQINHMYIRYFLWNFVGRESDRQDAWTVKPGEWFKKDLPEFLKTNKARNNYYLLPLILGLFGMFFHYSKSKNDWLIVMLLFLFTGLAIIVYLNQPPVEPRERDYTYTGSFYAFSIWIGLGVAGLASFIRGVIKSDTMAPVLATLVGLSVPGILAAQNWDDHDRSNRYHSVDSAKNLLNSCAKNAILFTGGDNDTFPLWYVQEVEGFRTDVRVCNLSLLNTDWYISQMKRKAYDSEPLPISLDVLNYISGTNDQVYIMEDPKYKGGINLAGFVRLVKEKSSQVTRSTDGGQTYTILPSKTLYFPVDKALVEKANFVTEEFKPLIPSVFKWTLNKNSIDKKDLIILDILANNNWQRPVYFSTTLSSSDFLNLKDYTELEGLAHRLMPFKAPGSEDGWVNSKIMYDNMMNKFFWRQLNNPGNYYDENYERFPVNSRSQFYRLAGQLLVEDKKDEAKKVLLRSLEVMPDNAVKYDVVIPPYIPLLMEVGEEKRALEIAQTMGDRAVDNLNYLMRHKELYERDVELNMYILNTIVRTLRQKGKNELAAKYEKAFQGFMGSYQ
jgi:hypothetical protein